jgi:molybdate transport system substrate-binding protein
MKRSGWPARLSLTLLAVLACGRLARREEVMVFAAASLTDALKAIAPGFETETGHKVVFNFGGSNDLARQIKAGAPADVFFAADEAYMDDLEKAGLVRARDRVDLLSNVLVVVVPVGSAVKIARPQDLQALARLALADPQAVPAGVYARTWLESLRLWGPLKEKVVPTLDVRGALSAVESGNVDAGVVYRTDAGISKRVRVAYEVPAGEAPPIVYSLSPLASSTKPATAAIVRHLRSASALAVYRRYGFMALERK